MSDPRSSASPESGLLCPACRVDLVMSDRQGIEIDYCRKCRGVWLDRGELDKIIERSAAYEAGPPAQAVPEPPRQSPGFGQPWDGGYPGDRGGGHGGHHGEGRHGGGGGHGRRRGFLGGLFDD
ncbi:MAG TPA: zf-TFIIB domain-containing protein [Phenylobacterium sp.]|uniref:Zf-TFIIB domain-containing protein n=2 Tax=Phenylobacterium ferrooxidans TaxID=2982689 RepID=A0ABW6CQN0_9CAUL|nr:zf-TFIIB domain-containing protein [Phenylobacterium sp.]